MKVRVICTGKTNQKVLRDWLPQYQKRLSHYIRFEWTELPELKNTKNLRQSAQKEEEGKRILKQLNPQDTVVLFDENGNQYTSVGFASFPPGPNCWVKTSAFTPNYATTLIHEIGHWAGLLHTFSDELSGIYTCVTALDEVDCENEGDYVCDTPPTGMDFSCLDACPDVYSPWGLVYEGIPEVSESYMSYAPDACQWMFTPGQIDRMHEQLVIHRSTLIGENTFCEPYSNPTACQGDFNGNGVVDSEDLLTFLLIYGTSCE